MTTYNFDERIDRKDTASYKWDQSEKLFGGKDILPLWVADMDFQAPREVVEAIVERAKQGIYGYTVQTDGYYKAIQGWLGRRHQWPVEKEWLLPTPGIVPALSMLVLALTEPGDGVILQSPVYYPFYEVIRKNGREVVDNALRLVNGRYEMDYELLEEQAKAGAKLLLLCSPHNPGGRVWTREELERAGEICLRHNVIIVADEIHHDLVLKGNRHFPLASLRPEFADITVTCIAPSKTFNLAGLQSALTIIPNERLRHKYQRQLTTLSLHMESYFGLTAIESSYTYGEEWLEQLLAYIEGNVNTLIDYLAEHAPQIKVMRPEGTYLAWMDCRAVSEDPDDLKKLMYKEAGVAFNEGSIFGKQGAGYLRVNLACPRSLLLEALERFAKAVQARNV